MLTQDSPNCDLQSHVCGNLLRTGAPLWAAILSLLKGPSRLPAEVLVLLAWCPHSLPPAAPLSNPLGSSQWGMGCGVQPLSFPALPGPPC